MSKENNIYEVYQVETDSLGLFSMHWNLMEFLINCGKKFELHSMDFKCREINSVAYLENLELKDDQEIVELFVFHFKINQETTDILKYYSFAKISYEKAISGTEFLIQILPQNPDTLFKLTTNVVAYYFDREQIENEQIPNILKKELFKNHEPDIFSMIIKEFFFLYNEKNNFLNKQIC